jgi:sugar lactone lactonase YvrE
MTQSNAQIHLDDRLSLYRAAQQHKKKGEWEAGLEAVRKLLIIYPDVTELKSMHQEFQQKAQQVAEPYKSDPLYKQTLSDLKARKYAASLTLLDQLLVRYPETDKLQTLRNDVLRNMNQVKANRLRKRLIAFLAILTVTTVMVGVLFILYLNNPRPLAQLVAPQMDLNYAPHYLFSIYGVDKPIGVGISQNGDRIYVTEMGGSRLIKVFDHSGNPAGSLEPPHINPSERAPVYLAVDPAGRLYVTDREQHAVFIFSADGNYLESLTGGDMTLTEYIAAQGNPLQSGQDSIYNLFQNTLYYQATDGTQQSVNLPYYPEWSPLGIRFNTKGELLLTDVAKDKNSVIQVTMPADPNNVSWKDFNPPARSFGASGDGNAQFLFPNAAVTDIQGRVYVSDGNNRRISVWDSQGNFLFNFGNGTDKTGLSLPRGLWVDDRDRLYVVDAVGQNVKVYDVSQAEPVFLFVFGDFGQEDGQFNYPNDIAVDDTGRVYIVDRENNRIQVWSY